MERKIKREYNFKKIFFRFLMHIILCWIVILVTWTALLEFAIITHIIQPSNAVETAVGNWLSAQDTQTSFSESTIPVGADYACFSPDRELLWSNMNADSLEQAVQFAFSEEDTLLKKQSVSVKAVKEMQTLVITYQLRAVFTSPFMRRIFPSADLFLFLLLLLSLLSSLLYFVFRYARKIEQELVILQNVSEQIRAKNLEFETRTTNITELNKVLDSLLLLREELRHSLKEQWQMEHQKKSQLSALAHDIKTPLTIIKGNAELLSESCLTEEQMEYNHFILENTEQIHHYVTQMLEVAKIDAAPTACQATVSIAPAAVSCSFAHLLKHIEKTAQNLCLEKQLRFVIKQEQLPENLLLPEDSMKRILYNLLDNAVQYSPVCGCITLLASVAAETLSVSLIDEGCGFHAEALRYADTAFYRGDHNRTSKEHFGMGLAIVKQLVTELGGTITFANHPQGGAIVTIAIPITS